MAFLAINVLLLFGVSVALDRGLGVLGFRDSVAVGPPPHYEVHIQNLEFEYTLRTNDRGIRYRTIPLRKPLGVHRLVVLGDSATEGMGVSDEDRWTDRVERLFAKDGFRVEMINCAETGTSPFNYGQKLLHICLDFEPDAVLVGMHPNDVYGTAADSDPADMLPGARVGRSTFARELGYRVWPHVYTLYRDASVYRGRSSQQQDLLARVGAEVRERGIDERLFRRWLELVPTNLLEAAGEGRVSPGILTYPLTRSREIHMALDLDSEPARAKLSAVYRIFRALRDHCEALGIHMAIVLLPSPFQFDPRAQDRLQARLYAALGAPIRPEWRTGTTALERELVHFAEAENIPFLNLAPALRESARMTERPLVYELDNHMTPLGHEVSASAVYQWLRNEGPVAGLGTASAVTQ
jgi:lysophospholipase L1-like esterase